MQESVISGLQLGAHKGEAHAAAPIGHAAAPVADLRAMTAGLPGIAVAARRATPGVPYLIGAQPVDH
jgi:hypothetical protein